MNKWRTKSRVQAVNGRPNNGVIVKVAMAVRQRTWQGQSGSSASGGAGREAVGSAQARSKEPRQNQTQAARCSVMRRWQQQGQGRLCAAAAWQ